MEMTENSEFSACAQFAGSTQFCVGGISVEVQAERGDSVFQLPGLNLFQSNATIPDIRLRVDWVDCLRRSASRPLFDSGSVWRLHECGDRFRFDFVAEPLSAQPYKSLTVDSRFCDARLEVSREFFADRECAPLQYPLDELLIMHRLTQEKAIELHGAGIVRADGVGNLFVGHSGAGKSTTTRLWTSREDVEVLSDDRIIVRREEEKKQVPRFARNDNGCRATKRMMRMYGTPWHGEACYASPNSAPLARILILEHGHGNVLTPLSPSQAVAELFARAFVPFHRHEYIESALAFLQELVDSVPVYRFSFEPDERAVDTILNFRD